MTRDYLLGYIMGFGFGVLGGLWAAWFWTRWRRREQLAEIMRMTQQAAAQVQKANGLYDDAERYYHRVTSNPIVKAALMDEGLFPPLRRTMSGRPH